MRRQLGLWGPVGLYMLLIFSGSAQSDVPDLPWHYSDKQMHAAAYAGLSAVA